MPDVTVKKTRIHFLERAGSSPLKVVFIHGSGGNACLWRQVMEELAEFHSFAVDLPGHGASDGDGKSRISDYSEFLKDFCDALNLSSPVLAGHSLGGGIALDFAVRFPERLKGLLLIGTGGRLRVLPSALELMRKMAEGEISPAFEPWGFSEKVPPGALAQGEKEWAKTSPQARYLDLLACDGFDILGQLDEVRVPALIVCGSDDRLTPIKYSEFLKNRIAGSRMEIIEGAGHMVMLENPKGLSAALKEFLRSCS